MGQTIAKNAFIIFAVFLLSRFWGIEVFGQVEEGGCQIDAEYISERCGSTISLPNLERVIPDCYWWKKRAIVAKIGQTNLDHFLHFVGIVYGKYV